MFGATQVNRWVLAGVALFVFGECGSYLVCICRLHSHTRLLFAFGL